MSIDASISLVDPLTATDWLEANTNNRRLRKMLVNSYARDMAAGDWQLAGDPIRFATDGTLLDGQHRLAAIVESGVTLPMFVIRGLEKDAQAVMDIGGKRNAADALRLRGKAGDVKDIASIARSVLMFENRERPTSPQIVQFCEDNYAALALASEMGQEIAKAGLRGGSLFGTAAFLLNIVDQEATETFMNLLATGADMGKGHPVLALRNRFIQGMPATSRDQSSLRTNLAYVFRAWNHWRDGRIIQQLRVASTDAYPIPH